MHKRELVAEMVKEAKSALKREGFEGKKTVSVKIRIHRDLRYVYIYLGGFLGGGEGGGEKEDDGRRRESKLIVKTEKQSIS